jgi:hypothetical protein
MWEDDVIFAKDSEHKIAWEDETTYYFGEPIVDGIEKEYAEEYFVVLEKE